MISIRGVIFVILMLMMVSIAAADRIVVRKARVLNEVIDENQDLLVLVDLQNPGSTEIEDLQVQFTVLETGAHSESRVFDLDNRDRMASLYYVPFYIQDPGIYTLKITIFNNDVRRVKYRYFEVQ